MRHVLVVLVLVWMVSGAPFYPFTTTTSLDSVDDTCSPQVTLAGNFRFFGSDFNSFFVNPNGQIFISTCKASEIPLALPQPTDKFMAVYWGNADFTVDVTGSFPASGVYYSSSLGPSPIDGLFSSFTASEHFTVTWNQAPYWNAQTDRYNNFQAVVATNRVLTYACFQYPNSADSANVNGGLDWTEGTGSTSGILSSRPAAVGFNAGDGTTYYTHPDSYSDRIRSIDGVPNGAAAARQIGPVSGQYCYLISGSNIVSFARPVITTPTSNAYANSANVATFTVVAQDVNQGLVGTVTITSGSTTFTPTGTGDINHRISVTQDISTFPDGPFTVTVAKTTTQGTFTSTTLTVTKDTVAPTVAITSPAANSWVNANTQYSFSVSGSGETGATVYLVITDGTNTLTTTPVPVTAGSWTSIQSLETLSEGNIVIRAHTLDPAGNPAQSAGTLTVRLDTTIAVAITSPPPGTVINPLGLSSVQIRGTTEVNTNTVTVIIQSDTSNAQGTATVTGTTWSITLDMTGLADGVSQVYATATDVAGNSITATSNVVKDTSTYVDFDPLPGFMGADDAASFTLSGVGEAGALVSIYRMIGIIPFFIDSATIASDFTWEFTDLDFSSVPDGTLTFRATAIDGFLNTDQTDINIIKDTSTSVSINSPSNGDLLQVAEVSNLQVSGSGERSGSISLRISSPFQDLYFSTTASASTGAWSFSSLDITVLSDGFIDIEAVLTDPAGNTNSDLVTVTKDTGTFVLITSPTPSQLINFNQQSSFVISGLGESASSVYVVISDSNPFNSDVTSTTTTVTAAGTWSLTVSVAPLDDGPLSIIAYAFDSAGNPGTSTAVTVTKDTISFISFRTPQSGDIVNSINVANSLFTGSAEPFGVVRVVATDSQGNTASTSSVTANSFGNWFTAGNLVSLVEGAVTLTGFVTDLAGNVAQTSVSVLKDTSAIVIITSPTPYVYVNEYTIYSLTVMGTGEPLSSVFVTIDDGEAGTPNIVTPPTSVSALGFWQISGIDVSSLREGTLRITATITDPAGNVKNSPTVLILKDTELVLTIAVPFNFQFIISDARSFSIDVSGFGDPGAMVYVTFSDSASGSVVSESVEITPVGTWSIASDVSDLADGSISIQATGYDVAGNDQVSQIITLTKDTSVSATIISQPLDGSSITQSQSYSLRISGTGEHGTLSLIITGTGYGVINKSVAVLADGTWSTTVDVSSLPYGIIEIGGTADDLAGNSSTINEIFITKAP